MRRARWSAAAFVLLLSGVGAVWGEPGVLAADSRVGMVEGSQSDPYSWKFAPVEITVPAGTTVIWRNDGKLDHTATADDGSFDSGNVKPGGEFSHKFASPGDFKYYCEPHRTFMTGVVHVTGGSSTPTTAAAPTTTAPAPGAGVTTTTAKPGQPTTTTTVKDGAAGSTTTTTAGAAPAGVTTSSAPAATPTSAPDVAGVTTTTTEQHADEGAVADHGSGGGSEDEKSSPLGIAFAAISTLILAGISAKLLASRS